MSENGKNCLFPRTDKHRDGPLVEKAWKKASMFENCLPVDETTVQYYMECGIAKFLLEGIVGKNFFISTQQLPGYSAVAGHDGEYDHFAQ